MDFNKELEISLLFDFYGQLLTEKQKTVIELYINGNYSLSEISDELKISRQAVRDSIIKSEKQLNKYEEQLKLLQKFNLHKNVVQKLNDKYGKDELFAEILEVWEV